MYVTLTNKKTDKLTEIQRVRDPWLDNTDTFNAAVVVFENDKHEVAVQLTIEDVPILAELIMSLSEGVKK